MMQQWTALHERRIKCGSSCIDIQLIPIKKWMNGKDLPVCSLELNFAYTFAGVFCRNKKSVPATVFYISDSGGQPMK
jgi:hypothetical protein